MKNKVKESNKKGIKKIIIFSLIKSLIDTIIISIILYLILKSYSYELIEVLTYVADNNLISKVTMILSPIIFIIIAMINIGKILIKSNQKDQ